MNRVGDLGLLFGILSIFYNFGSLEFSIVFALAPYFVGKNFILLGTSFDILSAIAFFLFIGALGKSAQVGLHT
jgi:NADH-quinone oxidoreductase subunit L